MPTVVELETVAQKKNERSVPMENKGPFIYYEITFLGFLDPPPPM